jgi:hypothetical protein
LLNGDKSILYSNSESGGGQARLPVVIPNIRRVFGGLLDTSGGAGTPAKAFKAQGTGTAKQFKDAGVDHPVSQAVKDGLSDQIRGGPDAQTLGDFEDSPPRYSADNSHKTSRPG